MCVCVCVWRIVPLTESYGAKKVVLSLSVISYTMGPLAVQQRGVKFRHYTHSSFLCCPKAQVRRHCFSKTYTLPPDDKKYRKATSVFPRRSCPRYKLGADQWRHQSRHGQKTVYRTRQHFENEEEYVGDLWSSSICCYRENQQWGRLHCREPTSSQQKPSSSLICFDASPGFWWSSKIVRGTASIQNEAQGVTMVTTK